MRKTMVPEMKKLWRHFGGLGINSSRARWISLARLIWSVHSEEMQFFFEWPPPQHASVRRTFALFMDIFELFPFHIPVASCWIRFSSISPWVHGKICRACRGWWIGLRVAFWCTMIKVDVLLLLCLYEVLKHFKRAAQIESAAWF